MRPFVASTSASRSAGHKLVQHRDRHVNPVAQQLLGHTSVQLIHNAPLPERMRTEPRRTISRIRALSSVTLRHLTVVRTVARVHTGATHLVEVPPNRRRRRATAGGREQRLPTELVNHVVPMVLNVVDDEVPQLVGEVDDSLPVRTVLERRTVGVSTFWPVLKMNGPPLRVEVVQVDTTDSTESDTDFGNQLECDMPAGGVLELPVVRLDALDFLVARHLVVDFLLRRHVGQRHPLNQVIVHGVDLHTELEEPLEYRKIPIQTDRRYAGLRLPPGFVLHQLPATNVVHVVDTDPSSPVNERTQGRPMFPPRGGPQTLSPVLHVPVEGVLRRERFEVVPGHTDVSTGVRASRPSPEVT